MKPTHDNATAYLAGRRVRVYFNLHRRMWSIQVRDGGRWVVACHAHRVELRNVRFVVSEAGRQRVLRERRKNVHAYVEGEVDYRPECAEQVRYDPYRFGHFFDERERPVRTAWWARLEAGKVHATGLNRS